jgi:hypothetical protein
MHTCTCRSPALRARTRTRTHTHTHTHHHTHHTTHVCMCTHTHTHTHTHPLPHYTHARPPARTHTHTHTRTHTQTLTHTHTHTRTHARTHTRTYTHTHTHSLSSTPTRVVRPSGGCASPSASFSESLLRVLVATGGDHTLAFVLQKMVDTAVVMLWQEQLQLSDRCQPRRPHMTGPLSRMSLPTGVMVTVTSLFQQRFHFDLVVLAPS